MTKKKYKSQLSDIPLAENVKLLKDGSWGYIHNGKAIFQSVNVETTNLFSKWVNDTVLKEAKRMQLLEGETKPLPKCHLCDAATWRVEGNYYEAQIKIPKG